MKKTNFLKQLTDISQEAYDFIKKSVKSGQTIRLFTKQEAEENDNIIYEMPNISVVDKYSNYDEYGVVAVSKDNSGIMLHIEGKGEQTGVKKQITLDETGGTYVMSDSDTCFLADELSKIIKNNL